jgi:hypothetical protein
MTPLAYLCQGVTYRLYLKQPSTTEYQGFVVGCVCHESWHWFK